MSEPFAKLNRTKSSVVMSSEAMPAGLRRLRREAETNDKETHLVVEVASDPVRILFRKDVFLAPVSVEPFIRAGGFREELTAAEARILSARLAAAADEAEAALTANDGEPECP